MRFFGIMRIMRIMRSELNYAISHWRIIPEALFNSMKKTILDKGFGRNSGICECLSHE